jgi:hypothetical protein
LVSVVLWVPLPAANKAEKLFLGLTDRASVESHALSYVLRINDGDATWRIIYRIYADAILIVDVFNVSQGSASGATLGYDN